MSLLSPSLSSLLSYLLDIITLFKKLFSTPHCFPKLKIHQRASVFKVSFYVPALPNIHIHSAEAGFVSPINEDL